MKLKIMMLIPLIMAMSCSINNNGFRADENEETSNQTIVTSNSIISDPQQDPYAPENMSKALNALVAYKSKGKSIASTDTSIKLVANYLYVRFLPYGKKAEAELKRYDTSLVLFKHPMDYKQIQKPIVYIDSTLSDSITPYFATVPVNYVFGAIPYEVIKELFLVEPLDDSPSSGKVQLAKTTNGFQVSLSAVLNENGLSLQQVELASLLLTGNLDGQLDSDASKGLRKSTVTDLEGIVAWSLPGSTWKPSGTLKFYDDTKLQNLPLVGVRVTAGYSYYWRSSTTDAKGYFQSPERWSYSVDYEANFDCAQFLLENGWSSYGEDLEIEWNDHKSAWNTTFTGNKAKWSIIWTAAYQYFYGEIYGLSRPRQNEWWNLSLDIQVWDNKDGASAGAAVYTNSGVAEWIDVNTANRPSSELYANTIHELAHSAHYFWMKTHAWLLPRSTEFSNLPIRLKETYTAGVDWYFKNKRYGGARQYSYYGVYTGLLQDLIDNDGRTTNRAKSVNEYVSGFTMPQLEAALFKTTTWNDFRDKLKNDYVPSVMVSKRNSIDALFLHWETVTY